MLDPGAPAATPFTAWPRTGLQQFSLVIEKGKIPALGSLEETWLRQYKTWCSGIATLNRKIIGIERKSLSILKLQQRLTGALARRIYHLQDAWMADAGRFPVPPCMHGCVTFVLDISPWTRRPDPEKMPEDVRAFAPGSRFSFDGPYSPEKRALEEAWGFTQKKVFIQMQSEGPALG